MAKRIGEAVLTFLVLIFMSYLLTWPNWHPVRPEPTQDRTQKH